MKSLFPHYCRKTEAELEALWQECVFVPDANVLLDLYRYSETPRAELLGIFQKVKDRIWIPHHVALEFMRNRQSALIDQYTHYERCESLISTLKKELDGLFKKHRSLERHVRDPITALKSSLEQAIFSFEGKVSEGKARQDALPSGDKTFDRLCDLFDGRIGAAPTEDELRSLYKEGDSRFANQVPPGFLDATGDKKKSGVEKYGDWIVWQQTLSHATVEDNPIVMITGERGKDWWWIVGGRTLGPHPSMVEEMLTVANVQFHLYETSEFMKIAKTALAADVKDKSIEEVSELSDAEVTEWTNAMAGELANQIAVYKNVLAERMEEWCLGDSLIPIVASLSEIAGLLSVLKSMRYIPNALRKQISNVEVLLTNIASSARNNTLTPEALKACVISLQSLEWDFRLRE